MSFTLTTAYTWVDGEVVTATKMNTAGVPTVADGQTYTFGAGAAATPSINFTGATTTGFYYAASKIGIAVAASSVGTIDATTFAYTGTVASFGSASLTVAAGSAASPSIGFTGGAGCGFYFAGGATVGFAISGSSVGTWSATAHTIATNLTVSGSNVLTVPVGSAASPSIVVGANCGIYSATNILRLSTNGVEQVRINASAISHNDDFLYRALTAMANGAAGSAGTLTNAPAVGNPTKWLKVDDNGTTRYVPAW